VGPTSRCGRLPGLGLQSGSVWGNRHQYTRADVANGNDDLSLHVNLSGVSIVSGRRGEIALHDGDAVLFSYAESRMVTRPDWSTTASFGCLAHHLLHSFKGSTMP
jgi:hypothetical protein